MHWTSEQLEDFKKRGGRVLGENPIQVSDSAPKPQPAQDTPRKYRNKPTEADGIKFDSKKEAKRFLELKMKQAAGLIADLELQKRFPIVVKNKEVCVYIADFVYFDLETGKFTVEDVKSAITRKNQVYRLKKKLMSAVNQIEITEI